MMTCLEERLTAENAYLKQRIADLTNEGHVTTMREVFGLSDKQARLLAILFKNPRTVTLEAIYASVFEYANGDGPDMKIVAVVVCKVRRCLEAFKAPGRIESIYGTGYRMSPELRAWVSERVSA